MRDRLTNVVSMGAVYENFQVVHSNILTGHDCSFDVRLEHYGK